MRTPRDIIDRLTADAIAARVGVSPRTVTNKATGLFPAWWFPAISDLGAEHGVTVPHEAFRFSRDRAEKSGAAA